MNFIVETCGKRARIATKGPRLTPQILRETFAVRTMRGMVEQEEALRDAGLEVVALNALIERHDRELLRLLGSSRNPSRRANIASWYVAGPSRQHRRRRAEVEH